MECTNCGSNKVGRNGLCESCAHAIRKAERMKAPKENQPISKVSVSMAKKLSVYAREKAKWIRGKKCAVYPKIEAQDIHHMAGREGYHDEWARENDVPLLLDKRFWLPVSRAAHIEINNNPKWACENGYSFLRVSDPVFRKLAGRTV